MVEVVVGVEVEVVVVVVVEVVVEVGVVVEVVVEVVVVVEVGVEVEVVVEVGVDINMNDHLLESSMGMAQEFAPQDFPVQDFTSGQAMIRQRSLAAWLFAWSEPKLRADLDAPVGNEGQAGKPINERRGAESLRQNPLPPSGKDIASPAPCPVCHDSGVRSYHELPGTYGVEPCGEREHDE